MLTWHDAAAAAGGEAGERRAAHGDEGQGYHPSGGEHVHLDELVAVGVLIDCDVVFRVVHVLVQRCQALLRERYLDGTRDRPGGSLG